MKPVIILFVLFSAAFSISCSKDERYKGESTISCVIDGKFVTFYNQTLMVEGFYSSKHRFALIGYEGVPDPGKSDRFVLNIESPDPIIPGIYGPDFDGPNGPEDDANINITRAGQNDAHSSRENTANRTEVNVISIDSAFIEGSFKGDIFVRHSDGTFSGKRTVTDGRFRVKRQ